MGTEVVSQIVIRNTREESLCQNQDRYVFESNLRNRPGTIALVLFPRKNFTAKVYDQELQAWRVLTVGEFIEIRKYYKFKILEIHPDELILELPEGVSTKWLISLQ